MVKTTGYGMKLARTDSDGIDITTDPVIGPLDIVLGILARSVTLGIRKRKVALEVFP